MNNVILSRADTFRKETEIKTYEIDVKYSKISDAKKLNDQLDNFSLEALETNKGRDHVMNVIGTLERDKLLIRQAITFISPELSGMAPLCPGAIYLMGAASGTGKSTCTAAIAHALFLQKKSTFIVSNEETSAKIYARIACIELGVDFNMYIQDKVVEDVRKQVALKIFEIEPFVTIADDPIGATTVECIEKLLYEVNNSGKYSCIIIDFLQRIVKSTKNPTGERVHILYNFKDILTDYAQHAKIPVILMTQLVPLASDEQERNVESRIKWARGIYESAACVIEIIKLKGIPASTFYISKGRFMKAEVSVTHKYNCGKFNFITKAELKKLKESIQQQELNNMVEELSE